MWECQAHVIPLCNDKKCQSTKSIHMQPIKSAMNSSHMQSVTTSSHMWSVKPAMLQSTYKMFNQVSLCNDKNCHLPTLCVVTRTANLPSICVMKRTVNLSSVCICHNLGTRSAGNQQ